jgi:uncharacterized radical SAM protein YgiQ
VFVMNRYTVDDWLPITKKEIKSRGWDDVDVVIITGDAYIDHPSYGSSVIGRLIESRRYRVAIVPQPNWQDDLRDFRKMGVPRLFFAVTSGSMDSMVKHYTAGKRLRTNDAYSTGGQTGLRPDYAAVVYSNILKKLYPDVPVVLGGLEASLRRSTHYDYWSDSLKAPIIYESKADLLIYGMGEQPVLELLKLMDRNLPFKSINTIAQTVIVRDEHHIPKNKQWKDVALHSHEDCLADKDKFADNFTQLEKTAISSARVRLIQRVEDKFVVINPGFIKESEAQLDKSYSLPYTRLPHPKYRKKGPIPAYNMIRHSVTLHRGCFGGCAFCAICAHQGKHISSRSEKSIIEEVESISRMDDFRGYISDLGGPSANMYKMSGRDQRVCGRCSRPSCVYPSICGNLDYDHRPLMSIYDKAEAVRGVKKCIISSGIRYDLLVGTGKEPDEKYGLSDYTRRVISKNVSGRLKVAPEHSSDSVLARMRKPSFGLFKVFKKVFDKISSEKNLNQQIVPYFISSHPGSEPEDMAQLAYETKCLGFKLEQVQDFTPTPMTLSSTIYYTGKDPYTGKRVYTAKRDKERAEQRLFFFWYKKENKRKVVDTLKKIGRSDLIKKIYGSRLSD